MLQPPVGTCLWGGAAAGGSGPSLALGAGTCPLCLHTAGPVAFKPEAQRRAGPSQQLLQQARVCAG